VEINLLGYYGYHNIGDDLMLQNLITFFLSTGKITKINVFCRADYYQHQKGVIFYPLRRNSRWIKAGLLIKNGYTLWGGGTCIYQAENSYGLFELARMQKIVRFAGNKFAFLGIGIGELPDIKYQNTARKLLRRSNYTYLRDEQSYLYAQKITGNNKRICLGGDLVFLGEPSLNAGSSIIKKISFSGHYNYPAESSSYFTAKLKSLINHYNCEIYFLPAHTGDSYNDNTFHNKIAALLPKGSYQICNWKKPEDYINILSGMDFHIGIRLHSLILADMAGLPNCGIAYSPKVTSYLKKTKILTKQRIIDIKTDNLIEKITKIKEEYIQPLAFMKTEKKTALNCLERLMENVR
jgi:polysaccharide pyruvyl transferase WcaK-like protein